MQLVFLGSGVDGEGVGDGAPRDVLEFIDTLTGVAWRVCFFRSLDQEGMPELCAGVPGSNLGQWPIQP